MAQTNTYNIVDEIVPIDRAFFKQEDLNSNMLDAAGLGTRIGAKTITWFEQPARVFTDPLASNYTIADGVIVATDGTVFTAGDIIELDAMVFSVVSIAVNTLTVNLIEGTDANATAGAIISIVSSAVLEGDETSESTTNPKIESLNVTQIFRRVASVTDSAYETSKEVGDSQLADDVADQSAVLKKNMKKMLWNTYKLAPSNNASIRVAGGIPYWITTNGGFISTAGTTITTDNLSTFVDYMVEEKDYNLTEIWMNPAKHSDISKFDISYFTKDMNEATRGFYADSFLSKRGNKVLIRTDRDIPVTEIYAVNSKDVDVVPFRDMKTVPLAKNGDSTRVQLVGEYTVTCNPANKMGKIIFTA
jgi:hypothetical protein